MPKKAVTMGTGNKKKQVPSVKTKQEPSVKRKRMPAVNDVPVKAVFFDLACFEREQPHDRDSKRQELRKKLLSALGLDPALFEVEKVYQAFNSLARTDTWFFKQGEENCKLHWAERSKFAKKVKLAAKRNLANDEGDAIASLLALAGN
jgi:hypothetical protein